MAKISLRKIWSNITTQLINKKNRSRSFIFLTSFIFSYISLGGTIANFLTDAKPLCYFSLGAFVLFDVLIAAELIYFHKNKKGSDMVVTIPMLILIGALVISYLFLAPARSFYIYWICVIPICFFLTFGMLKGVVGSTILFAITLAMFYIPPFYQATLHWTNTADELKIKGFFILYYVMCSSIGVALGMINANTINRLDKLKDTYYEDANTDSLTGLRNQAYYLTYVNNLPNIVKEGDTIGLMFIDIDDFKLYNDKFGHTTGNDVLVSVANKLNEVPHALIVRWGGDEFAIVERNLTKDEFVAKANYLLKSVAGLPSGVTISIGLAYFVVDDNFNFQKIFNEADMQAIRAKGKGKNCIVINEKE